MSTIERTPRECFERFREVLAGLLAKTVDGECPVLCEAGPVIATIGFKRGKEFVSVPLQTDRFNGLSLYVIQTVNAQRIDKGSNKAGIS